MTRVVELGLAGSPAIKKGLLLLLLTDPFNGDIIRYGVVEASIIDYVNQSYETIISGEEYPENTAAYSGDFIIHDDFLYFRYRYADDEPRIDSYSARINWIDDNDISIGAYPNSIIHSSRVRTGVEVWRGIPNRTGYFSRIDFSSATEPSFLADAAILRDMNGNSFKFGFSDAYDGVRSYLNSVITDSGMYLTLFAVKWGEPEGKVFIGRDLLNSFQYKDGEETPFTSDTVYSGEIPEKYDQYYNVVVDPKIEFLIKKNVSGYIANIKQGSITVPISEKECYLLRNGGNPFGWDRRLQLVDENYQHHDLEKPDLIKLYPWLNIDYFALQSYEVYYDTTNGFWRDYIYSREEIMDA